MAIVDAQFGPISVVGEDSRLVVSGPQIQTAVLSRTAEPWLRKRKVPIGTRNRRLLSLDIGGIAYKIKPGRPRLSRRAFVVRASNGAEDWILRVGVRRGDSVERGTWWWNSIPIGECTWNRAEVRIQWSAGGAGGTAVTKAPAVTPQECALGYVLAAGFGTGSIPLRKKAVSLLWEVVSWPWP